MPGRAGRYEEQPRQSAGRSEALLHQGAGWPEERVHQVARWSEERFHPDAKLPKEQLTHSVEQSEHAGRSEEQLHQGTGRSEEGLQQVQNDPRYRFTMRSTTRRVVPAVCNTFRRALGSTCGIDGWSEGRGKRSAGRGKNCIVGPRRCARVWRQSPGGLWPV